MMPKFGLKMQSARRPQGWRRNRESHGATLPEQEDSAANEGAPTPREGTAEAGSGPDDPFADNDSDGVRPRPVRQDQLARSD